MTNLDTDSVAGGKPSAPQDPLHVVFMVDDQAIVGESIRRMLAEEPNVEFHFCRDPAAAVAEAQRVQPSIILQDLVMPDVDGLTLLAAYRDNPATRDIPVIVLSSRDVPEIKREAFTRGANDYLVKLPDPIELIARVKAHSRSYHTQGELRSLQRQLEASNAVLKQLSTQDALTGIPNRRHFDELLTKEWRRCLRSYKSLGLLLIDVDGFKSFNDHYGHQEGDRCLQQVAQALSKAMLRPGDVVARYGGEEFAVILPETDLEGSMAVAERLRQVVSSLHIAHEHSPCEDHVTISLGVAACVPSLKSNVADLISESDQALYRAKRGGRNRSIGSQGGPGQLPKAA
ncbi:MAG: diguanylate cyclase [Verrucomicrobiales bacterium]|nr:diguanylate cyclase [Verrucomicrobiales bacterium]